MVKFGRYGFAFGRTCWFQSKVPTQVWHFLWFWLFKEARPSDIDKHQKFPMNTPYGLWGKAVPLLE